MLLWGIAGMGCVVLFCYMAGRQAGRQAVCSAALLYLYGWVLLVVVIGFSTLEIMALDFFGRFLQFLSSITEGSLSSVCLLPPSAVRFLFALVCDFYWALQLAALCILISRFFFPWVGRHRRL